MPSAAIQLTLLLVLAGGLAAVDGPAISPSLQRIDLRADQVAELSWVLRAVPGTTVTATIADCACLRVLTTVPAQVGPSGCLDIRFRVTGMRPGSLSSGDSAAMLTANRSASALP